MAEFRAARILRVFPERRSVDLKFMDDGSTATSVPVMSGAAGGDVGMNDLPAPNATRDIIAVVGLVSGAPMVFGFVFPPVRQMLFADLERTVYRHASDAYVAFDRDGNLEVYHPSGTYLRIGETADHEDLTGRDFDGRWAITKNTDKAVHVRLRVANAGAAKATVTVAPTGDVTLDARGSIAVHADGAITIDSGTSIALTAPRIDMN